MRKNSPQLSESKLHAGTQQPVNSKLPESGLLFKFFKVISSLELTTLSLLLLSVLVVWGTLYQVNNGVYAAQEHFFKAWFTFIAGIIPFPAVKTVIVILSVNLLASAMIKRPVSIRTAGLFITHIGVAFLVASSVITSSLVQESTVTLAKDQSASETYDFSSWNLAFTLNDNKSTKIYRFPVHKLENGQLLSIQPASRKITIRQLYANCSVMTSPDGRNILALKKLPPAKDAEHNFPGLAFSLKTEPGKDNSEGQVYYLYSGSQYPAVFTIDGYTVNAALVPFTLKLPLQIELRDFNVEWHPGTTQAKSYKSRLRALGKGIDREVVVEMNRPFRYGAFTFYQMGYSGTEGNYMSTLAVVRNPLRFMPYIASCIIVAGLFLHFFMKMWHALSSTKGIRRDTK